MQLFSLTINGERHQAGAGTTLEGLLAALGVPQESVVVEHNGQVVTNGSYGALQLQPDDRLEIVRFVPGG